MGGSGKRKNEPISNLKKEITTRRRSLIKEKAIEAGKKNKLTERRSASVNSTSEVTPPPEPPLSNATEGPSRANDLFDSDMADSITTTPPPSATEKEDEDTETEKGEDDSDLPNDDSLTTPTPKATGKKPSQPRVNAEVMNDAPQQEIAAPMPDLRTPTPHFSQRHNHGSTAALQTPNPTSNPTPTAENQTEPQMTPTRNNTEGSIHPPPTKDTTNEEEKSLEEVRQLMKDSSKTALTGEFRLNVKIFSPPKGEPNPALRKNAKPRIEWVTVNKRDIPPELQHTSSNYLDMMSEALIKECASAAEGREHNLGHTSQILVEKGFKWLFKLMTFTIPKEKQSAWITHGIRSVLAVAGVSLSNMIASVDMFESEKSPHQWTLVSFTKEGYDAFTDIRTIFDPRSGSAISVREWTMDPPRVQIFSIGAIIASSDSDMEAAEAMECLKDTVNELVKNDGVTVTRTAMAIAPKSGKVKPINIHLRIEDSVQPPFFISPTSFRGMRISTPRGTRVSSCKFGRLCPNCGSDSHVETKECPWISFKIGDKKINFDVPKDTTPGHTVEQKTEPSKKRKRDDQGSDDETPKLANLPKMRDARPKGPPTKKPKVSDLKGKGQATSPDEMNE